MTKHTPVPQAMVASGAPVTPRSVTVLTGDTIKVGRNEKHLWLLNGNPNPGTVPQTPVTLGTPNTIAGFDIGGTLLLQASTDIRIPHATSGVYFKDEETFQFSSSQSWLLLVRMANGSWYELTRDGETLASDIPFGQDHVESGDQAGYHDTVNHQADPVDLVDGPLLTMKLIREMHMEDPGGPRVAGVVREYLCRQYVGGDTGIDVQMIITTFNASVDLVNGYQVYWSADTPVLPSWYVSVGFNGFRLRRVDVESLDNEPDTNEYYPSDPLTDPYFIFRDDRFDTIMETDSSGDDLLHIADGTIRVVRGEFDGGIDLATKVYPKYGENVDIGTEDNRFRRVATDEVLMGENGVTIRQGDGDPNDADPADTATAGSLRLSNDGNVYLRNDGEWKPLAVAGGASCAPISEPFVMTNPDDAKLIDLYLPPMWRDETGSAYPVLGPDGETGCDSVKLTIDPVAATVLVDGTPTALSTVYPLPAALDAMGTAAALESGTATGCVVMWVDKTNNVAKPCWVRTDGTTDSVKIVSYSTYATSGSYNLNYNGGTMGYSVCRITNTTHVNMPLDKITRFPFQTNGNTVPIKITIRDGSGAAPGSVLAETDTFTLPDTTNAVWLYGYGTTGGGAAGTWDPATPVFVTLPSYSIAPGETVCICYERVDNDNKICQIHYTTNLAYAMCNRRVNTPYGSATENTSSVWGNFAATTSHGHQFDLYVKIEGLFEEPAATSTAEYFNVLFVGQGGSGLSAATEKEMVVSPFEKLIYGDASAGATDVPISLVPYGRRVIAPPQAITVGDWVKTLGGYADELWLTCSAAANTIMYGVGYGRKTRMMRVYNTTVGSYYLRHYGFGWGWGRANEKNITQDTFADYFNVPSVDKFYKVVSTAA